MRVAPRTLGQIRTVAMRAREMLGIAEPMIDMVDLLENALRRNGIHFHVVDSHAIPGEAARAIPDKGLLLLTCEAYEAVHAGYPSHMLLIPHEIGHFVLGHAASFARSHSGGLHGIFEDSEIQADQFSHEFLMPVSFAKRYCRSVEDLQRIFVIPQKEARIRYSLLRLEGHLE